jgi:hypothetical protein
VFLDEGIRLRPSSPVWCSRPLKLVVSVEPWRSPPPKDWWTSSVQEVGHRELGGVTKGSFKLFLAKSNLIAAEVPSVLRSAPRGRLSHVIDPTVSGIWCQIPVGDLLPLGRDAEGLLRWDRRLMNVEAPSVFTKTHWVKRRLSPKELLAVLDLPRGLLQEKDAAHRIKQVLVPGKVRSHVVDNVRTWMLAEDQDRKRPRIDGVHRVGKRAHTESSSLVPAKMARSILERPGSVGVTVETSKLFSNASNRVDTVESTVTMKSTKADDASVPVHLWDDRCLDYDRLRDIPQKAAKDALEKLRTAWLLPFWKKKVCRDFSAWLISMDKDNWWRNDQERSESMRAGNKAIHYSNQASWWEWDGGSFPFFWRWPREYIRDTRDGVPPRFVHEPPACMDRQRPNANPEFAKQERSKVFKVIKRGYLRPVKIEDLQSLMHYFSVPKGDKDIQMVYDGSKCKLNAATFAPWFAVPTSASLERTVVPNTVQGDNDFADMFLNFQLHREMQKYTGVDASDL